jgi:hypothetical protein
VHHISLGSSAHKATLSPVTRYPSYLAKETPSSPESKRKQPLFPLYPVSSTLSSTASSIWLLLTLPFFITLLQVHLEFTTAHWSTLPLTKLHGVTILLHPTVDVPRR